MLTRILFALALAGATFAACDAHATESTACDRGALARAEASAVTAERVRHESMAPGDGRVADEMVRAATEQLRAARALCAVAESAPVSPFASEADPFATEPQLDPDLAEWRAVMGDDDSVEW